MAKSADDKQIDLAARIKRSESYVTSRITGKKPWSMDDVYTICDEYDIPYDQIHIYFPRGGRDSTQAVKQPPSLKFRAKKKPRYYKERKPMTPLDLYLELESIVGRELTQEELSKIIRAIAEQI